MLISANYTGSVKINGTPMDPDIINHDIGYVRQDESLIPNPTVYQNLHYTAELQLRFVGFYHLLAFLLIYVP